MSDQARRFAIDDHIDGRYRVVELLPGRGVGERYKVVHDHLQDHRVVKVLRGDLLSSETDRRRFRREATIAASINHPNLAILHDFASFPDGTYYMVEEFLEGDTIADLIKSGTRFDAGDVVLVAWQVLDALAMLHAKGIVHRDITPANLMRVRETPGSTTIKIIDLGIAKPLTGGEGLTEAGAFVGRPHYASPEQLRQLEGGTIDHRTDFYSLGVVLYEMINGRVPFDASTPLAYLLKQISEEITTVRRHDVESDVPAELDAFIVRLLRLKSDDRFPNAEAALGELEIVRDRMTATGRPMPAALLQLERPTGYVRTIEAPNPVTRTGYEPTEFFSLKDLGLAPPSLKKGEEQEDPFPSETELLPAEDHSVAPLGGDVFPDPDQTYVDPPPRLIDAVGEEEYIPTILTTTPISVGDATIAIGAKRLKSEDLSDTKDIPIPVEVAEIVRSRRGAPTDEIPVPSQDTDEIAAPPTDSDNLPTPSTRALEQSPERTYFETALPTPDPQGARQVDNPPEAVPAVAEERMKRPVRHSVSKPVVVTAAIPVAQPPASPPRTLTSPATILVGPSKPKRSAWLLLIPIILLGILAVSAIFIVKALSARKSAREAAATEATTTAPVASPEPVDSPPVAPIDPPLPSDEISSPAVDLPGDFPETTTETAAQQAPTSTPRPVLKRSRKTPVANPRTETVAPVRTPPPPPPSPPPTRTREGSLVEKGDAGVVEAKLGRMATLTYPSEARRQGIKGSVILKVLVDHHGSPTDIVLLQSSGSKILDDEGIKTARNSTYIPATKDGVRVRIWKILQFNFE